MINRDFIDLIDICERHQISLWEVLHGHPKLVGAKRAMIYKELSKRGYTQREIAAMFNVSHTSVGRAMAKVRHSTRGRTRGHG
jgi:hypothetical protein